MSVKSDLALTGHWNSTVKARTRKVSAQRWAAWLQLGPGEGFQVQRMGSEEVPWTKRIIGQQDWPAGAKVELRGQSSGRTEWHNVRSLGLCRVLLWVFSKSAAAHHGEKPCRWKNHLKGAKKVVLDHRQQGGSVAIVRILIHRPQTWCWLGATAVAGWYKPAV